MARKPTATLIAEAGDQRGLQRAVGALDLTALGIGGIIGTGIFVIIGEAIGDSGPAIVLSFVLAAVTCIFSALSYAELASTIPISGSAYSYSYATLGEIVAWIIGWDLLVEYAIGNIAVAIAWSEYFNKVLGFFGAEIPYQWIHSPFQTQAETGVKIHGVIDLNTFRLTISLRGRLCGAGDWAFDSSGFMRERFASIAGAMS